MLKDGTYAAWFKTPQGQGTGIVHVAHGEIWGRDNVMTYDGTCEVDGNRFYRDRHDKKAHRRAANGIRQRS